ncbi:MAG: trehalose-phosphatase [Burkholderiaceae bacterium]
MNFQDLLGPPSALFLDFDGTLVDLAPQPDAIQVPAGLVTTLALLRDRLDGALAVISGRPIAQLDAYLAPLVLPASGVHGAERRSADGQVHLLPAYSLAHVEVAARTLLLRHPELQIEHKRGSLAVHYRGKPELEGACIIAMQAAVDQSPGLTLLRGKMVVEAKPAGASKGRAIEAFLREAPFAGRKPVFAGDDITDEPGFGAVQRAGGVGIKIGEGESIAGLRMVSPATLRLELQNFAAAGERALP